MLYEIAKETLEHGLQDEEKTMEVLLNVCETNKDQYKRIFEATEEDGIDSKQGKIREG